MPKRRKYSEEYKRAAIEQTMVSGVTLTQVAEELGINPNLLGKWRRELQQSGAQAFPGQGTPRDEEVAALKRELARVKKERDFLKEAAAFFAKESS